MGFEWRCGWRRLGSRGIDWPWSSCPVFVTELLEVLKPCGRRRGHRCGDDVRVGGEVVMRKIVSWLLRYGNRRRP
jgi:hypothetical protein